MTPDQDGLISPQVERLFLTFLLAALDQCCDDRLPLILKGTGTHELFEALHLMAHEFVNSHDPREQAMLRENLIRELARLP